MTKRVLSLLLCLVMIFSLSIGCMTSASALELSDVAAKLPVITGQPQDAVIEGTGSATFTVRTVFDSLLDMIQTGDFDLEAWLGSMLEQGIDIETIIAILEEMGFNWSDIVEALLNSNIDWEQILKALQSGGFDLEEILGQLVQNPNFDISAIIASLVGSSDVDISALLKILEKIIGSQAAPLAVTDAAVPNVPAEINVDALLAALQQILGSKLPADTIEQIKAALNGSVDLDAVIKAVQDKLGPDVDLSAIIEAIQSVMGQDFDMAAVIEALKNALGEQFDLAEVIAALQAALGDKFDLEAVIKAIQGAMGSELNVEELIKALVAALGDNLDLQELIEALKGILGENFDLETIIKAIQAAMGGELDVEALIKALVAALGDNLDLQELIDALKGILGDNFDLEAIIKALINGGFDLETILEILKQMGYTPEDLFNLLIGRLISYKWYTRVSDVSVAVAVAPDANDYAGETTKVLTVTRDTAPAKTEQYTYFCAVTVANITYHSNDATLTILVKDPTPDKPDLNRDDHFAYITGYGDGTVRPQANITRAETATIFYNLLTRESRDAFHATTCSFSDVPDNAWYTICVATLTKAGILHGYGDGTFRPDAPITRAEMATIVALFAELKETSVTFSDIQGHWAQKNIELAASNGWISGDGDGTFRPDDYITRAETVSMVNRALDRAKLTAASLLPGMKTFSDNLNPLAWYYLAIQEAANSHEYTRDALGFETWTALT